MINNLFVHKFTRVGAFRDQIVTTNDIVHKKYQFLLEAMFFTEIESFVCLENCSLLNVWKSKATLNFVKKRKRNVSANANNKIPIKDRDTKC